MSFAGFKKQINKANQMLSEKIGGAEKTQYDEDFVDMEKRIEITALAVDDIINKTTEFLQPNPLTRAKLSTAMTVSKMRGQTKNSRYPQPEGNLGECFLKYGRDLGEDSCFGQALLEAGEAYKQLAEVKDSLDFNVKQNFLDPLDHLKQKELKEISQHRKKMQGRRLDYDCKKRKVQKGGSQIPEEEIRMAEEKFEESREIVENGMRNLLDSDVEQVRQLQALVEAQLEFHQQAQEILSNLTSSLGDRITEGVSSPGYKPKRTVTSTLSSNSHTTASMDSDDDDSGVRQISYKPQSAPPAAPKTRLCKALYDFEPENEGELAFSEGDMITLVDEIDENWLEGSVDGRSGYFPRNYVDMTAL